MGVFRLKNKIISLCFAAISTTFTLEYANSNLVNGGEFGFEGSLMCGILLLIPVVAVFREKSAGLF
jgi:hypothetical protein